MSVLFQRHSGIKCFFCHSHVSLPRTPRNFRCSVCGCWNRYDKDGEILSDEPAMHDESLNSKSFAKRASPSKDRLPTVYGKGPFCHTCQTNQMLLVNLLSNYLPPPNSPEYARRLEMLPEYRESLHRRYPPVCDACLPAVEDEIRRKDHMARTQALGGWLKESKGKEQLRRVSDTNKEREKVGLEMVAWRTRGFLWVMTVATALVGNATAAMRYRPLQRLAYVRPVLPIIALLSLLWTVWDPTYSAFRKAQRQGRDVRVQGKNKYITMQMVAWLSRLITSGLLALTWYWPDLDHLNIYVWKSARSRLYFAFSLALELTAFGISCSVLRLQQPPAIRLVNTNTHRLPPSRSVTPNPSATPFIPSEPDLLSTLTLSSKPVVTPQNPVFGLPSLLSAVPPAPSVPEVDVDADAMDWTPTGSSSISPFPKGRQKAVGQADDGSWLRPQRFFAPEQPTGLESLFERALSVDDIPSKEPRHERTITPYISAHVRNWWWVYMGLLLPLFCLSYKPWEGMWKTSNRDIASAAVAGL